MTEEQYFTMQEVFTSINKIIEDFIQDNHDSLPSSTAAFILFEALTRNLAIIFLSYKAALEQQDPTLKPTFIEAISKTIDHMEQELEPTTIH